MSQAKATRCKAIPEGYGTNPDDCACGACEPNTFTGKMTTKHTHPVIFGRKVDGCPRCLELRNGSKPVRWNTRRDDDARQLAEIRAHDCKASRCGIVCTFGEW